jgi:hypothetical protein
MVLSVPQAAVAGRPISRGVGCSERDRRRAQREQKKLLELDLKQ